MIIFRYLARNIYTYFLFVFIGFIALFVILDFISESKDVTAQYNYAWAMGQVLLRTIYYLYQFVPIAALIACVLAIVKLSQRSEFVIMRMHGLSFFKILKILTLIGLPLVVFTFSLGEYLVPLSAKLSQEIKQRLLQKTHLDLKSGFWLKYQVKNTNKQYMMRITQLNPLNNLSYFSPNEQEDLQKLQNEQPKSRIFAYIYLYEFVNDLEKNDASELKSVYFAKYATVNQAKNAQNITLHMGQEIQLRVDAPIKTTSLKNQKNETRLTYSANSTNSANLANLNKNITNYQQSIQSFKQKDLDFQLPPGFIEYLGMKNKAKNMTLKQLHEYIQFLKINQQNSYEYELNLWQKYTYPFTNLLMLYLGGLFIYFKQRQAKQIYIFAVIMSGLLMYLGQTILLQMAQLNTWQPNLISIAPLALGFLIILTLHLYLQKK